jgi:hypothetical protein
MIERIIGNGAAVVGSTYLECAPWTDPEVIDDYSGQMVDRFGAANPGDRSLSW